jgi:hypothetical protein
MPLTDVEIGLLQLKILDENQFSIDCGFDVVDQAYFKAGMKAVYDFVRGLK